MTKYNTMKETESMNRIKHHLKKSQGSQTYAVATLHHNRV